MRSPLAVLLLCHYLLVGVLGSAWATLARQEAAPTAVRPYVHSVLCQSHNYLRLDCFDSCNGDQSGPLIKKIVDADDEAGAPRSYKEKHQIDEHLLAERTLLPVRPRPVRVVVPARPVVTPDLTPGVAGVEGPPPKVSLTAPGLCPRQLS